ncbi:hypothetical protein [Photorhabdus heterorhabditis]|uniref:Uncharacterized protein n=1 Tax=Photorhabdus heterorhabditis TaxID=880156 RepID=A0A5B0WHY5_9GAMM|nr:hypothetical protein [Photorhabdus heterorhabditis]KAA1186436.1 hypothetical protein F0L16_13980 [Photorhabdus heterorhabditis]KOY62831.1 hypothetical protein AM629_06350 [Photorhabdus heterorhabditis]MBS9441205.1 hypothetical protein [Photorhabdus heterorhabditis]NRN29019.1 hypothetical protein [Photorhabdus heterorhabditis subsp. aluminescens]
MKYTTDKATALLRASETREQGASKHTIRILHGRNIAEELEYENVRTTKRGIRSWLKKPEHKRVTTIIVDVAINYYGFDPLNSEVSIRKMDFNSFMQLLSAIGYDTYMIHLNKIVEVLIDLKDIDDLDSCIKCNRPYVVPLSNDTHCPRCRAASYNSALLRYSSSELDYTEV